MEGGFNMVVAEGKKRRYVTVSDEIDAYLIKRSQEETSRQKNRVTVSDILEELIKNDKKIREAFNN